MNATAENILMEAFESLLDIGLSSTEAVRAIDEYRARFNETAMPTTVTTTDDDAAAEDAQLAEYERQEAIVASWGPAVGLNADWNCQSYRIGTVGAWGVFVVDEEDGCWALVARRIVDDAAVDREIAHWSTREFTEVLGTFPENAVGRLLAMAKAAVAA